jgi:hypothetical protein
MAGLVPAIHVLVCDTKKDVDARHKAGHDGGDAGSYRRLAIASGLTTLVGAPAA